MTRMLSTNRTATSRQNDSNESFCQENQQDATDGNGIITEGQASVLEQQQPGCEVRTTKYCTAQYSTVAEQDLLEHFLWVSRMITD